MNNFYLQLHYKNSPKLYRYNYKSLCYLKIAIDIFKFMVTPYYL